MINTIETFKERSHREINNLLAIKTCDTILKRIHDYEHSMIRSYTYLFIEIFKMAALPSTVRLNSDGPEVTEIKFTDKQSKFKTPKEFVLDNFKNLDIYIDAEDPYFNELFNSKPIQTKLNHYYVHLDDQI